MQHQTVIYVPVAMHPDLFGGESPILQAIPCDLQCFEVEVSYTVRETKSVRVAARNEDEAAELAEAMVEAKEDGDDFEAVHVELLRQEPTAADIEQFQRRLAKEDRQ